MEIKFLVDSGSSVNVVCKKVAHHLPKIDISPVRLKAGISNNTQSTTTAIQTSLKLQNQDFQINRFTALVTTIFDKSFQCIIGNNVLQYCTVVGNEDQPPTIYVNTASSEEETTNSLNCAETTVLEAKQWK